MNTFHDLFRQPTRAVGGSPLPDRRQALLPGFVERSPKLHLWSSEHPPGQGPRLLIGVASWSGYDMNLLDLIEEAPENGVRVEVFDTGNIASLEELNRMVPGLAGLQTPFVGFWTDGGFAESAEGFDGRKLVARVCGLDWSEVESRMNTVLTRK